MLVLLPAQSKIALAIMHTASPRYNEVELGFWLAPDLVGSASEGKECTLQTREYLLHDSTGLLDLLRTLLGLGGRRCKTLGAQEIDAGILGRGCENFGISDVVTGAEEMGVRENRCATEVLLEPLTVRAHELRVVGLRGVASPQLLDLATSVAENHVAPCRALELAREMDTLTALDPAVARERYIGRVDPESYERHPIWEVTAGHRLIFD